MTRLIKKRKKFRFHERATLQADAASASNRVAGHGTALRGRCYQQNFHPIIKWLLHDNGSQSDFFYVK